MKVLQVLPGALVAGMDRQVIAMCSGLKDHGVDVRVALWHRADTFKAMNDLKIPVLLLPCGWRGISAVSPLQHYLARERIDVVHSHGYRANVIAWYASRGQPTKRVRTEHGLPEPFRGWAATKMFIYLVLDILARKNTSCIIYVSEDLYRRMHTRSSKGRVAVVHNVNSYTGDPFDRAQARQVLKIPQDALVVGGAGRLVPVKDFTLFIDIAAQLKHRARFLLFGDGPLRAKLEEQNARLGFPVELMGERSDVPKIMAALDLLLLTSRHEGLPTVLLEALTAGVPVVAPNVGGIAEVLTGPLMSGLCYDRTTVALAEACNRVLCDAELRMAMQKEGKRRSSEFTPHRVGEALKRIYEELIS